MIDWTRPISFRVPLEHRDTFEREAIRLKVSPAELSQRLVIRGLNQEILHDKQQDFILKNIAFMTQVLSEVVDSIVPDKKDEIMTKCQENAKQIVTIVKGESDV